VDAARGTGGMGPQVCEGKGTLAGDVVVLLSAPRPCPLLQRRCPRMPAMSPLRRGTVHDISSFAPAARHTFDAAPTPARAQVWFSVESYRRQGAASTIAVRRTRKAYWRGYQARERCSPRLPAAQLERARAQRLAGKINAAIRYVAVHTTRQGGGRQGNAGVDVTPNAKGAVFRCRPAARQCG